MKELYRSKHMKPHDRATMTFRSLKPRIAYKVMQLEKFPFTISNMPSIKAIQKDYIHSYSELEELEHSNNVTSNKEFYDTLDRIFKRHTDASIKMARGLLEWKLDLSKRFCDDVDFLTTESISSIIPTLERTLDEFYFDRLSTRIMLNQYLCLDSPDLSYDPNYYGVVVKETNLVDTIKKVYDDVSHQSNHIYDFAPNLTINKKPLYKFKSENMHFPYVPFYLEHIFGELFKNSFVALYKGYPHEDDPDDIPPINITLSSSTDGDCITIKISDKGSGISQENLPHIWSYFFSTADTSIFKFRSIDQFDDFCQSNPMTGFGHGLPLTNLMVKHFDGKLSVNSVEGMGTDVHLYLKGKI
jgi:hypothetical protein